MSVEAAIFTFVLDGPNVMYVLRDGHRHDEVHFAEPVRSHEDLEMRAAWWTWEHA